MAQGPGAASYEQLIGDEEDVRLSRQNEALASFDQDIYRRVLSGYAGPSILDVGCGTADMIFGCVEGHPSCRVFGFDISERQIAKARTRHPDGTFSVLDVEGDSFPADMRRWMEAEGVEAFDVINCSMVLMHLRDPKGSLARLRPLLVDGGTLVVREVDDGLSVAYPDPEARFERLFSIYAGDSRMGDRHCGRKVLSYLLGAGFSDVRLERQGLANISMADWTPLYEMAIPHFLDYMRKRAQETPEMASWRESYEWFRANIDRLHDSFLEEGFYFSLGFMSLTAR